MALPVETYTTYTDPSGPTEARGKSAKPLVFTRSGAVQVEPPFCEQTMLGLIEVALRVIVWVGDQAKMHPKLEKERV